jgi:hypothetical protein
VVASPGSSLRTPHAGLPGGARLATKKADGLVVQVERGTFKLNAKRARSNGKARA